MNRSLDYDRFADAYAETRFALPWILTPLFQELNRLPARATVVEIGCGTGNYIIAAHNHLPDHTYHGFDVTPEMLRVAETRCPVITFRQGDAEEHFPYPDACCDLAFVVDVLHHLDHLDMFFAEAGRILKPGGRLLVVTDSEDNIRARSLTVFFPEALDIELSRYPSIQDLRHAAERAGLSFLDSDAAKGTIPLDADFISKLEAKCASALRLIPAEAHRRGVRRVRQAARAGGRWCSCYTVLLYQRPIIE